MKTRTDSIPWTFVSVILGFHFRVCTTREIGAKTSVITLYTSLVPWYVAKSFCSQEGGHLVQMGQGSRQALFLDRAEHQFMEHLSSAGQRGYWVDHTSSYPSTFDTPATSSSPSSNTLISRACHIPAMFICEYNRDEDCHYETKTPTGFSPNSRISGQTVLVVIDVSSAAECQNKCSNTTRGDEECWVWLYLANGVCYLHMSADPWDHEASDTREPPYHHAGIKRCVKFEVNDTALPYTREHVDNVALCPFHQLSTWVEPALEAEKQVDTFGILVSLLCILLLGSVILTLFLCLKGRRKMSALEPTKESPEERTAALAS